MLPPIPPRKMLCVLAFAVWSALASAQFEDELFSPECPNAYRGAVDSLRDVQLSQCRAQKASPECQGLYERLKAEGGQLKELELKCERRTQPGAFTADVATGCALGVVDIAVDTVAMVGDAAKAVHGNFKRSAERLKECDREPARKRALFETYNASVPKLIRIDVPSEAELQRRSCVELEQVVFIPARALAERRVAASVDAKALQKNPRLSTDEAEYLEWKKAEEVRKSQGDQSGGFGALLAAAYRDLEVRQECLSSEATARLNCYILGTVAGGPASAVAAAKITRLMGSRARVSKFMATVQNQAGSSEKKEILAALKNPDRDVRAATQAPILEASSTLATRADRIQAAGKLLGRKLSSAQEDVVWQAHQLPIDDIQGKARLLRAAGFEQQDRELLLRAGITGDFEDAAQVERLFQEFSDGTRRELDALKSMDQLERKLLLKRIQIDKETDPGKKAKLIAEHDKLRDPLLAQRQKYFDEYLRAPGIDQKDVDRVSRQARMAELEARLASESSNLEKSTRFTRKASVERQRLGELHALRGEYQESLKAYDDAAKNIQRLGASGLETNSDKYNALRALAISPGGARSEIYQQLVSEIAGLGRGKFNEFIFSRPATDFSLRPAGKPFAWPKYQELAELRLRESILHENYANRLKFGESWLESNESGLKKAQKEYRDLMERRAQVEREWQTELRRELGEQKANRLLREMENQAAGR